MTCTDCGLAVRELYNVPLTEPRRIAGVLVVFRSVCLNCRKAIDARQRHERRRANDMHRKRLSRRALSDFGGVSP